MGQPAVTSVHVARPFFASFWDSSRCVCVYLDCLAARFFALCAMSVPLSFGLSFGPNATDLVSQPEICICLSIDWRARLTCCVSGPLLCRCRRFRRLSSCDSSVLAARAKGGRLAASGHLFSP